MGKAFFLFIVVIASGFVLVQDGFALSLNLYDGSLGTLPSSQGWTYLTNPLFGARATRGMDGTAALLDTTPAITDSAGYFAVKGTDPMVPTLDRSVGFSLGFSVQIQAENHMVNNRGGFSVLVVTDDTRALELAFWQGEIWAYSDGATGGLFAHGEGASFDTTAGLANYLLNILGNDYFLYANGNLILNGVLRDYTAFSGTLNPYRTPNLIFLGDDTSSASSNSRLAQVELTTVPEPATVILIGFSMAGLILSRNIRSRTPSP